MGQMVEVNSNKSSLGNRIENGVLFSPPKQLIRVRLNFCQVQDGATSKGKEAELYAYIAIFLMVLCLCFPRRDSFLVVSGYINHYI